MRSNMQARAEFSPGDQVIPFELLLYRLLKPISRIPHQTGSSPGIGIIVLIPVHTVQSANDRSRYIQETYNEDRPAILGSVAQEPPRTILCFPSKKSAMILLAAYRLLEGVSLTGIAGIYFHGFKAFLRQQWRTSPLPNTTDFTLSSQSVTVWSNGSRVPVLEAHITASEITKYGWRMCGIHRFGSIAAMRVS